MWIFLILAVFTILYWHRLQILRTKGPTHDKKSLKIIDHPSILSLRSQIFPFFIHDIDLSNTNITTIPHYREILKRSPKVPTYREMVYLIKYKKFMESDEVHSMCGKEEIDQMERLILEIVENEISGCIIETGCWRGGISIYSKVIIDYFEKFRGLESKSQRKFHLFDTFGIFPKPAEEDQSGGKKDFLIHNITEWLFQDSNNLSLVRDNFKKFGMWGKNRVKLHQGVFEESIPKLEEGEIQEIAILRLDSDYYDSTMYILEQFYDKVSVGGFIVVDDYNNIFLACKNAVDNFRKKRGIINPIVEKEGYSGAVYWKKQP